MNFKIVPMLAVTAIALSACGGGFERDNSTTDKTRDLGRDDKDLSTLQAGIWIDPNGCDHWIIDDGIEGYLSTRYDPRTGLPSCTGHGAETVVYGPFKSGTNVNSTTETTGDGTSGSTGGVVR